MTDATGEPRLPRFLCAWCGDGVCAPGARYRLRGEILSSRSPRLPPLTIFGTHRAGSPRHSPSQNCQGRHARSTPPCPRSGIAILTSRRSFLIVLKSSRTARPVDAPLSAFPCRAPYFKAIFPHRALWLARHSFWGNSGGSGPASCERSTGGRLSHRVATQLTPSRKARARSVAGQTRRSRSQNCGE